MKNKLVFTIITASSILLSITNAQSCSTSAISRGDTKAYVQEVCGNPLTSTHPVNSKYGINYEPKREENHRVSSVGNFRGSYFSGNDGRPNYGSSEHDKYQSEHDYEVYGYNVYGKAKMITFRDGIVYSIDDAKARSRNSAKSIRCSSGQLVREGDAVLQLLVACGMPDSQEKTRYNYTGYSESTNMNQETFITGGGDKHLVYRINNVLRIFEVRDGIVIAIKDAKGYGK